MTRTLDRVAEVIDRLRPTAARSSNERDLAELRLVRDALAEDRTRALNRDQHCVTLWPSGATPERLVRELKRIDAEIAKLLRSEETLKRRCEILTSIPGISSVTAAG